MVNIEKHIEHWRKGSDEDFEVANQLINSNKIRHGLFFLHLSLEKILKAFICLHSNDIAPRLHNLVRLSELSGLAFEEKYTNFLSEMNPFNIEGRYPELWGAIPSKKEAEELLAQTEEVLKWLKNQL
jgi:HEPN domain-containing protein